MAFPTGSPKLYAQDIAKGFVRLTPISLRRFSDSELKVLSSNIIVVDRETRQQELDLNDFEGVRNKNQMLQRLKAGRLVLETYCKKRRIVL